MAGPNSPARTAAVILGGVAAGGVLSLYKSARRKPAARPPLRDLLLEPEPEPPSEPPSNRNPTDRQTAAALFVQRVWRGHRSRRRARALRAALEGLGLDRQRAAALATLRPLRARWEGLVTLAISELWAAWVHRKRGLGAASAAERRIRFAAVWFVSKLRLSRAARLRREMREARAAINVQFWWRAAVAARRAEQLRRRRFAALPGVRLLVPTTLEALGIEVRAALPNGRGVAVASFQPPATSAPVRRGPISDHKAGTLAAALLQPGDRLVSVNGEDVRTATPALASHLIASTGDGTVACVEFEPAPTRRRVPVPDEFARERRFRVVVEAGAGIHATLMPSTFVRVSFDGHESATGARPGDAPTWGETLRFAVPARGFSDEACELRFTLCDRSFLLGVRALGSATTTLAAADGRPRWLRLNAGGGGGIGDGTERVRVAVEWEEQSYSA